MKYTQKQIEEFAKMGYGIDSNGNLTKEVRLQKIVRTQNSINSDIKLTGSEITKKQREDVKFLSPKFFSRVKSDLSDEERMARGLVTPRRPGVVYYLLQDGTKVCRCCQEKKHESNFSAASAVKDGKNPICRTCDSTRQKTYLQEIKNKG